MEEVVRKVVEEEVSRDKRSQGAWPAGRRQPPWRRLATPTLCCWPASAGFSVIRFLLHHVVNETTRNDFFTVFMLNVNLSKD